MGGRCRNERGFSLIELLMVVGMLGLVMGAIYSLYSTHQKSAYSQAEVVEVQQNLRVAMDTISRDIMTAGIMVPAGANQVFAAPAGSPAFPTYSSSIRLNTASADGRFARVDAQLTVGVTQSSITLKVEAPAIASAPNPVDGFADGDNVRLIRPVDASQPLTDTPPLKVFTPNGTARGTFDVTNPTIKLARQDALNFAQGDTIVPGDMLVKTVDAATYPMTIDYYLVDGGVTVNAANVCPANQKCLVRRVNGADATAQIIAGNLSSLRFGYLTDSYTEASVPADLSTVRAVRITLQGATARTAVSGGTRTRAFTTVVKLRNRR